MIYLYGIIDSGEILDFVENSCGRRIRSVAENGLGMVFSPAGPEEAAVLPENILAHNAVMEYLMDRFTVLPVKFGTILKEERAAGELIRTYGAQFRLQLDRLRGKVEMGVKVLWDIEKLQKEFRESETSGGLAQEKFLSGSPGRKYLFRKYQERAPEMYLQRKALTTAAKIHRPMASVSEEARLSILRTPALMLSGAYLVARENTGAFREEYLRLKKNYSSYNFLLSGPWPPYNFVDLICLPGGENDEAGH